MLSSMANPWSPDSWKQFPSLFQPRYADKEEYLDVLEQITRLPPLVAPGEVEKLRNALAEAGEGKAFILHGGDCVERFDDCREVNIRNKLKIILQMSVILTHALQRPVVRIGRIGGQYFKPRSSETEFINGKEVLTYRGDGIHRFESSPDARIPDPKRLLEGFFHSAVTLNYVRSLIDGGFADLHTPYKWKLHHIEKTDKWEEYREIVDRILEAIRFMESFGGVNPEKLHRADFYTSHEGLHLGYETALTHIDEVSGMYYNAGAHMVWIGERTRDIEGGHVEYCRGISNPVGVKLGPSVTPKEALALAEKLNPANEPGKVVFITRFGAEQAAKVLPPLIEGAVKKGVKCTWVSDPMHGNTAVTESGIKTRSFEKVLEEIRICGRIFQEAGVPFGGVHFELTGEDVTECTGGAVNVRDNDLKNNYTTYCDPRLNYSQSLEMAFLISKLL